MGGGRTAPKNKANYINYFSDLLFMQIDHVLISVFVVSLCCLIFVICDIMVDISRLSLCCGNSWVQQNNIFLVRNTSGRGRISRFMLSGL